ncbi:MAG TPA: hypothetical protein VFU14_20170 [Acidimicrobiales bacterium]|nr:hypothetical protein [Acidimicrobiales bacterium]
MPTATGPVVPAFKAALLAGLRARALVEAQQVQVEMLWPGPATCPEGIYLGGFDDPPLAGRLTPGNMTASATHLDEVVEVPIVVQTWDAAPSVDADPEPRVFELFGELVAELRENKTVSDSVQWSSSIAYVVSTFPAENGGWASRLVATVTVHARIT